LSKVDSQPPSADLLGDLLGPLAIEGPPVIHTRSSSNSGLEGTVVEATAIVPAGEQTNSVQVPCIRYGFFLLLELLLLCSIINPMYRVYSVGNLLLLYLVLHLGF